MGSWWLGLVGSGLRAILRRPLPRAISAHLRDGAAGTTIRIGAAAHHAPAPGAVAGVVEEDVLTGIAGLEPRPLILCDGVDYAGQHRADKSAPQRDVLDLRVDDPRRDRLAPKPLVQSRLVDGSAQPASQV